MIWSNLQGRLVILILISPLPLWPSVLIYTSIHYFHEQYVIGTSYTNPLGPSLFYSLQLTFPAATVVHPSGNGLSPLVGIYQSTGVPSQLHCELLILMHLMYRLGNIVLILYY